MRSASIIGRRNEERLLLRLISLNDTIKDNNNLQGIRTSWLNLQSSSTRLQKVRALTVYPSALLTNHTAGKKTFGSLFSKGKAFVAKMQDSDQNRSVVC